MKIDVNNPEDKEYAVKLVFSETMYSRYSQTVCDSWDGDLGVTLLEFLPSLGDSLDTATLYEHHDVLNITADFGTTHFIVLKRLWTRLEEGTFIELIVFPDGTYDSDSEEYFYKKLKEKEVSNETAGH